MEKQSENDGVFICDLNVNTDCAKKTHAEREMLATSMAKNHLLSTKNHLYFLVHFIPAKRFFPTITLQTINCNLFWYLL